MKTLSFVIFLLVPAVLFGQVSDEVRRRAGAGNYFKFSYEGGNSLNRSFKDITKRDFQKVAPQKKKEEVEQDLGSEDNLDQVLGRILKEKWKFAN